MISRAQGRFVFLVTATLLFSFPLFALDSDSDAESLEAIQVLGGSRFDLEQPTAPTRVSKKKLEKLQTTNVNEALKLAPGVYVREEDGQGLRPNIGLRGTNPDRSKKIVILQDGILIGPAPYSAPAAYYVPSMTHTESLEVMSGFTAVHYGPNSIGGAVNYITSSLPGAGSAQELDFGYGSFDTVRARGAVSGATSWGGYGIQASRVSTSGFKELDGGGSTGFTQHDVLAKLKLGRSWLVTLGWADEDSHETYLGIAQKDFDLNPYRRYAASAADEMKWNHASAQIEYETSFEGGDVLKISAYHHQFARAWYRVDRFRDSAVAIRDVLRSPTGTGALYYDVLRGASDSSSIGGGNGEIVLANNDRAYVSQGVQARWVGELETGDFKHSYQSILRLHHDRIDRDHTYDFYAMTGGRLERTATARQRDRLNKDEALAAMMTAQDDITWGSWVFTGVGRWEVASFEFQDKLTGASRFRSDSVLVPGLGALRKFGQDYSARASVNRAVTMAGLDSAGSESREEAMNYELGFRYFGGERDLQVDLTLFYNDYRNLTGTCTASSGCAAANLDTQLNGGAARVMGAELRLAEGFQMGRVWIPLELNTTLISATLQSDFVSTNAEWGQGAIAKGDPLPYVPTVQYNASVGSEWKLGAGDIGQQVIVTYQSRTFDQSAVSNRIEIPAFGLLSWNGFYEWEKGRALRLKAENLLGREYAVAARPFGLRAGKPRSFMASLQFAF